MIRVIVADDHPVVRHGVCHLLDRQPDIRVVGQAVDGAELIGMLDAHPADVAVLDLSMPHLQGLELVQLVRESHPTLAIVVFTMQRPDIIARSLVQAGILGFVRKSRPVEELVRAVRAASQGRRSFPDSVEPVGDALPHERLTCREAQVFQCMIQGIPIKDIALDLEISASTASNHVAKVREKLGARTNGEVLLYASRHGLMG